MDISTKIRQIKIEKSYLLEPQNYHDLHQEVLKECPTCTFASVERIARAIKGKRLKEEDRLDNKLDCITFPNTNKNA